MFPGQDALTRKTLDALFVVEKTGRIKVVRDAKGSGAFLGPFASSHAARRSEKEH